MQGSTPADDGVDRWVALLTNSKSLLHATRAKSYIFSDGQPRDLSSVRTLPTMAPACTRLVEVRVVVVVGN